MLLSTALRFWNYSIFTKSANISETVYILGTESFIQYPLYPWAKILICVVVVLWYTFADVETSVNQGQVCKKGYSIIAVISRIWSSESSYCRCKNCVSCFQFIMHNLDFLVSSRAEYIYSYDFIPFHVMLLLI